MIFKKMYLIAFFVPILATGIELEGNIKKVFNDGQRVNFIYQKICVKDKNNCTSTYKLGNFKFDKINKSAKVGDTIKLEITDKSWFMLSPFNGILRIPNKKEKIQILMIPKDSTIYQTLFTKLDYFRIQLSSLYNEAHAINMVKELRRSCLNHTLPAREKTSCWKLRGKTEKDEYIKQKKCVEKKRQYYCIDNIYYQSILRKNMPNNGYIYKVNYGKYYEKLDALQDLRTIENLQGGWIRPYVQIDEK